MGHLSRNLERVSNFKLKIARNAASAYLSYLVVPVVPFVHAAWTLVGHSRDAKVVNRGTRSEYNPWPGVPHVERIFVRELSPQSHGNAVGIGMADATTDRFVDRIDWMPTMVNAQSAGTPARIRVPVHFAVDRECLQWVASTVGKIDPSHIAFGWIRNTLELDRLAVSENLRPLIAGRPHVSVERAMEMPWDVNGNLVSPFT